MTVVYCMLAFATVLAVVNAGLAVIYMKKWKAYTGSMTKKMTLKAMGV
ncbi:hypothetical protein [Serratia sp. Se-RSBMAAmG]|nr:hypothetical protein [Serratia sp. Se-RSBMAAmG]MDI6977175.1 hypothetical protein [Serratia sp. Se-RSBMAAmG]